MLHHHNAPPCPTVETTPLHFPPKLIQLLQAQLLWLVDVEWLGWRAGGLVGLLADAGQGGHGRGGEAGVGSLLLKLSCMEPTELVGLLASLRGLNSPTEDSLTSLTLMGSLVNTEASLAAREASVRGENS